MSTLAQDIAGRAATAGRTPEQQAAYERLVGTAQTVNEQREAGVIDGDDTPTYVQVNIGRNIDDAPMSAANWARFQGEAQYAMHAAGAAWVSTHLGCGSWVDPQGFTVSEESAFLSAFGVIDLDILRDRIAELRDGWHQDAIALIVGSELI